MKVVTISSVEVIPVYSLIYSKASSIILTLRIYLSISCFFSLLFCYHLSSLCLRRSAGFENSSPPDPPDSILEGVSSIIILLFILLLEVSVSSSFFCSSYIFPSKLFLSFSCFAFKARIWLWVSSESFYISEFSSFTFLIFLDIFIISLSSPLSTLDVVWTSFRIISTYHLSD